MCKSSEKAVPCSMTTEWHKQLPWIGFGPSFGGHTTPKSDVQYQPRPMQQQQQFKRSRHDERTEEALKSPFVFSFADPSFKEQAAKRQRAEESAVNITENKRVEDEEDAKFQAKLARQRQQQQQQQQQQQGSMWRSTSASLSSASSSEWLKQSTFSAYEMEQSIRQATTGM